MKGLPESVKEEYLRTHLEERYDVEVKSLHRLDRGVIRVDLEDDRRWIARVFPKARPIEHVKGDAAILQFLEQQDFPAERCAVASPVSVLYSRGILVTEYIVGSNVGSGERTAYALGEMLGRLHRLPAEDGVVSRSAGALHHYSRSGGGLQNDILAARAFLTEVAGRIPDQNRALYDSLWDQVAQADNCENLPEALIHPDPALKNLLLTRNGDLVFIDWTGAGRGPRIVSLAILLWSCALEKGGWSPTRVDAAVAGYRSQIRLGKSELGRLAVVMRIRPLVFACWRYRHAVLSEQMPDGTEWWWPSEELIQAIAARACIVFEKE
jgi:Ser/Thr protein kinase RdoA (MazF antagonist)